MRIQLLASGAVLVLGMLGASASVAQAQNSTDISGPLGSMTCSAFTALSPTAQADALKAADANSLTSNSGASTTAGNGKVTAGGTTAAGAPLTEGQLIAACQAASPTSSVHDAYSSFSSGATTTAK